MDQSVFSYLRSDLLLETSKRTTYFGKMRLDDNGNNLTDRMALTEGESFLFNEFLDDAVEQVYQWVAAFGRGVENSHVSDSISVTFTLQPREWWDRNAYSTVDRCIKEALVNFIIYRWFEYTNAGESKFFFDKFEDYAHQAQIGMNAEASTIQRRFNTPFNTIYTNNKEE